MTDAKKRVITRMYRDNMARIGFLEIHFAVPSPLLPGVREAYTLVAAAASVRIIEGLVQGDPGPGLGTSHPSSCELQYNEHWSSEQ